MTTATSRLVERRGPYRRVLEHMDETKFVHWTVKDSQLPLRWVVGYFDGKTPYGNASLYAPVEWLLTKD